MRCSISKSNDDGSGGGGGGSDGSGGSSTAALEYTGLCNSSSEARGVNISFASVRPCITNYISPSERER